MYAVARSRRVEPASIRTDAKPLTYEDRMKTCNSEEIGTQQVIFPPNSRPSDFEEGIELGRDQERQRVAAYFHDQLAPNLMALAFSIEAIRIELESEKHPVEAKLKDIRDRLSKMLQPIRENILDLVEDRPNSSSGTQYSASKAKTALQTVQIEHQRKAPAGQCQRPGV
jgi:signal transduction histidine kinase